MKNAGKTYYFTATNFNHRTTADDIYAFFSQAGNINELYLFIDARNEFRGLAIIGFDKPVINIPNKTSSILFEGRRIKISHTMPFDLTVCKKLKKDYQDSVDFSHKRDLKADQGLIRDAITPDPALLPPKVPVPASLIEDQAKKQKETKPAISGIKKGSEAYYEDEQNEEEEEKKNDEKEKKFHSDRKRSHIHTHKRRRSRDRDRSYDSDYDYDHYYSYDTEYDRNRYHSYDRDHYRDRHRGRNRERSRDRYRSYDYEYDSGYDREIDRHKSYVYDDMKRNNEYLNYAQRLQPQIFSEMNSLNRPPNDFLRTPSNFEPIQGRPGIDVLQQAITEYLNQKPIYPFQSSSPNFVNSLFLPPHPPTLAPSIPQIPPQPPQPPQLGPMAVEEKDFFYDRSLTSRTDNFLKQQFHQPPPPPPPPPSSSSLLSPPLQRPPPIQQPPFQSSMMIHPSRLSPPPQQMFSPPPEAQRREFYRDEYQRNYRDERADSYAFERGRERERRYEGDRRYRGYE